MSLNNLFKDLLMYKNFYDKYKAMDKIIESDENIENNNIKNLLEDNTPKPISEMLKEPDFNEVEIVDNANILGEGKNDGLWIQLGDIIQLTSPENEMLNNHTFFVDYIDRAKMVVIEKETLEKKTLMLNNGVIENGSVKKISILYREKSPSYAVQNNLLPSTWIDIIIEGSTITGQITNLEEDMIEVRVHPTDQTIYINFDYKGLPEDLSISKIIIRDEPEIPMVVPQEENMPSPVDNDNMDDFPLDQGLISPQLENEEAKEEEKEEEENLEQKDVIIFGETLKPIRQMLEMDLRHLKYSIEEQTTDFLEVLLSNVPTLKRNDTILNNFNTIITRFKQLRERFSVFDKNNNIVPDKITGKTYVYHDQNWKPLIKTLTELKQKLYWILLVGKNVKNVYDAQFENDENYQDIHLNFIYEDLNYINESLENYKTNTISLDQNRYIELYKKINLSLTPYKDLEGDALDDIIYIKEIMKDMTVLIKNNESFLSHGVKNTKIKPFHYDMVNLNTGLEYITQTKLTNAMRTNHHVLTPNDMVYIKSFITLPEQVLRFSKSNLPGTNILERSNLSKQFLQYWQLFNSKSIINNVMIDDLETDMEYNENNFLNEIKNFELTAIDKTDSYENYQKYLHKFIPKTRILFNLIKKNITDKLSFYNVVEFLEPFSIYPEDITYMQYVEINNFINGKNGQISKYAKNTATKKGAFNKLLSKFKANKHEPTLIDRTVVTSSYPELGNAKENVISTYFSNISEDITRLNYKYTHSELLKIMIEGDFAEMYNSAVALSSINLIIPENINQIIQEDKNELTNKINESAENSLCTTFIIAKKYDSVDNIFSDNDKEPIFFDKQFDDTDYSILSSLEDNFYKKTGEKRISVPNENFLEFTAEQLQSKYKYDEKDAPFVAESLINGKKKVLNGHYAVVTYVDDVAPNFSYYIRENSQWFPVPDNEIPPAFLDNNLLCNVQPTCTSVAKKVDSVCTPNEQIIDKTDSSLLDTMVKQFETEYMFSMDEIINKLKHAYDVSKLTILHNRIKKYNPKSQIYMYNLGLELQESEIIRSPYTKYLDMIMAKTNFVEKNELIILFCKNFSRKAEPEQLDIVSGEFEDETWFYCKETNVKLIPSFLNELAEALVYNNNYNEVIDRIIKRCGTLSDDGNNWVDKNSGRIIKLIDFDVEEGYTGEGFKVVSRELLVSDAGNKILSTTKVVSKNISKEVKIINNIINGIASNMKINISNYHEFIISKTKEIFNKICPSEIDYDLKAEDAVKRGKPLTESYEDFTNKILLYLTLGCFLIVTQISIPSVKTKYSVAGCFRSFEGYPVGASGDLSAITYLTCVAMKMKSSYNPWKMMPKSKTKMMEFIQQYVNEYFMKDVDVLRKINEKSDYILSNMHLDENILEEHNIISWTNFLPPLQKVRVKNVTNVDEDFMTRMIRKFKSGSHDQTQDIEVLESKIIKFSMGIQELIQKIVETEELLIIDQTSKEPHTENACCNNNSGKTTLMYFVEKNKDINLYNMIVQNFSKRLNDIKMLTNGILFMSKVDTKMKTYKVQPTFNEATVYNAFVKYCNFKNTVPIDEDIKLISGLKPDYIHFEDSIVEIIQKLKSDNRNYTNEQLLRLLQIVNKKNILITNADDNNDANQHALFSHNELINKLLANLDASNNTNVINSKLQQLLKEYLDLYNIHEKYIGNDIQPIINIITSLKQSNKIMKSKVLEFINRFSKINKRDSANVESFLSNLTNYKVNDVFNEQNMLNYIKNCVHSAGKVFPGMISEKADYKINAPKYWGISKNHKNQLTIMSEQIFEPISKYYDNIIIKKLLKNIQENTIPAILLSNIIPLMEKSTFNLQTSILLMEHCFLAILFEYVKLSDNPSIILGANEGDEEEEEEEQNVSVSEKDTFKNKIALLLTEYFKIFINVKKNISITYDEIMDNVFKLKEAEKNRIRKRAENLTKEQLQVDNEFKEHKIGFWSKGENVRYYDGDRFDEEFGIMQELNEKERRLNMNKNKNNADLLDVDDLDYEEETARFIDEEEGAINMDEDWDDGNYYGEDE